MIKKSIKKCVALGIIAVSVLAFNPISATAEWKQDANGWWYADGNSWYTGWKEIYGKWYYFDNNGYMAHDTVIEGYYLNSNGAWISSTDVLNLVSNEDGKYIGNNNFTSTNALNIVPNEDSKYIENNDFTSTDALNLVSNEDSKYIGNLGLKGGHSTTLSYTGEFNGDKFNLKNWGLPKESYYTFELYAYGDSIAPCEYYFVGKETKNVYAAWTNGYEPIYQIKNNQKVKTYTNPYGSNSQWR